MENKAGNGVQRVAHRAIGLLFCAWPAEAMELLWLVCAVAVPLAFNPWGTNAFEVPKSLLLRALVLLMLLVQVSFIVEGKARVLKGHRPVTILLGAVLTLGLTFGLATLRSMNPRASLWGSFERQQGLLTTIAYLVLFVLTAVRLRTRPQANRLWAALVCTSAPIVAYGLVQVAGRDPLDWHTDATSGVLSTIGRANFVGSYLVLVMPLTAGLALSSRRRWPCLLLLAGQFVCLVLTRARAAWIGCGASVVAWVLIRAVLARNRRLLWAMLGGLLLLASLLLWFNWPGSPLPGWVRSWGISGSVMPVHLADGSVAARRTIWRTTLSLIAGRPWWGYGPEMTRVAFLRAYPPQLVYYQGRHVMVDRAHNLWLDLAVSVGLIGTLAWGALLIAIGSGIWRKLKTSTDLWARTVGTAVMSALVGHIVDLQFSFDLTATATVFWLELALGTGLALWPVDQSHSSSAAWSVQGASGSVRPGSKDRARLGHEFLKLSLTLIVLAALGLLCLRPLVADSLYRRSKNVDGSQPHLTWAQKAVAWWPGEPEYHIGLAWNWAREARWDAAAAQLAVAESMAPNDPWIWLAQGDLYARWGDVEPIRYAAAEAAYRKAIAWAPNVAAYHTALGLTLVRQNRIDEGLAELERAVDLDATDGDAYRHLALVYQRVGRTADAERARQISIRLENP